LNQKQAKATAATTKPVDEKEAERLRMEAEYAEVLRKEKEKDAAWRREVAMRPAAARVCVCACVRVCACDCVTSYVVL